MPERFIIDDSLILPPSEEPESVEVVRGTEHKAVAEV
jgi:hypothetical protein